MTKMPLGTPPFLLGFEQLERMVEQAAQSKDSYPPYNIEQVSDRGYRISLAVAGFREEDLSVSVENNKLVVRGMKHAGAEERVYLHRGIATRQFVRSFVLAEGVEVSGANTCDGLLHIEITKVEFEKVVQVIEINKNSTDD